MVDVTNLNWVLKDKQEFLKRLRREGKAFGKVFIWESISERRMAKVRLGPIPSKVRR